MGTFAAGIVLNRHTLRPVAGVTLQVRDFTTAALLTPDGGQVTTGAVSGGYDRFVVPGVDSVTLVAPDGTLVDLVSIEAQEAAAASAPFLASAEARLTELESHSGSGSGILNVSGTVNLTDVAGIREVYATAAATVQGVALAAGDAAVFRHLAGAWTYMVVGTHTTWQSVTLTPVTANVPTANDTADTITWTPKTGVQYLIGGSVRTPPYSVGDVTATVVVTAQATAGYSLTGTSSWSFNFTGSGGGDTTNPTGGTLTVSGTGDAPSTRTLTVTGASDAGGLHAQPYRFSTNGGSTWSTYQSAAAFTTAALAAGTYQPRATVRDAAGNTTVVSAADFTLTAAPATPAYDTAVQADNPIVYVPFTETATPYADVEGVATVAPGQGQVIWPTPDAQDIGTYPRSALFYTNGSSQRAVADLGDPAALKGLTAFSVEMLVRLTSLPAGGAMFLLGYGYDVNPRVLLRVTPTGALQATLVNSTGAAANANPAAVLTAGTDYHLAITYGGTTLTTYINGTSAATGTLASYTTGGSTTNQHFWRIGGQAGTNMTAGGATNLLGHFAGFAVHGTALSAARVLAHAQAAGVA